MNKKRKIRLSRKTLELALKALGVAVGIERRNGDNGEWFSYDAITVFGGELSARAAERRLCALLRQHLRSRLGDEREKEIRREEEDRCTERILRRVAKLPHNHKRSRR